MLNKFVVDLLCFILFFIVIGMLFQDDLFCLAQVLELFFMVVLPLVVYNLIELDPTDNMQHDLFLHVAFFTQALYVLQLIFQLLYLFLSAVFLVSILVLLYLVLLALCLKIIDLFLLLLSHFVHIIVFLPDGQKDIMCCNLSIVVNSFRFLPQLIEVPAGREGQVVVSEWRRCYLTLLLMAFKAGSLTV